MSATTQTPTVENSNETDTREPDADACGDCATLTRRRFMQTTAAATALAATGAGTAAAAETTTEDATGEVTLDFTSPYVHDPRLMGVATVETVNSDMDELEYIADDDSVTSLVEDGFVIAQERGDDDDTQPWNPVRLAAANIDAAEFSAFPRGTTYDHDADSATDEEAVEWHDPTHWTTTNATNGSISLAEADHDAMRVSTASLAAGETVSAAFDLSAVGSSDATITSGMSRKFLQNVVDVDALPSAVLVEFAIQDSAGKEVTATYDPAGDASTESVLLSSTGPSQVAEARVGELESAQAVTLDDIQVLEIRVSASGSAADGDFTLHGVNLERSTAWEFGTQEYQTTDDNGETVVETQEVTEPAGTFGIRSLDTLADTPFSSADLRQVEFDVEARMSELPEAQVWARILETPDTYDRPHKLEQVAEWETPSAYELDVVLNSMDDTVLLPGSRFNEAGIALGIEDIDEWSDIEDSIAWTDRLSTYENASPEDDVELSATVSANDRNAARLSVFLDEDEASDARQDPPAVVVSEGESEQGIFGGAKSAILGVLAVLAGALGINKFRGE